jgi:hypothetical protein
MLGKLHKTFYANFFTITSKNVNIFARIGFSFYGLYGSNVEKV